MRPPEYAHLEAFLERRRAATAEAWDLNDDLVLLAAGEELPVPGRGDRMYPFRAHSEYFCLTDRERPRGVLGYSSADGWIEFVAPVTADELLWTGLDGDREGVPDGTRPLDELDAWVDGRPVRCLGATAHPDVELRDALAFETIVAAGNHAAVLHFSPTSRELRRGDLLLVDAGAEHRGYACDVTRTYVVGGTFDAEQALVYDTVRRAGEKAIAACRPGMHWHEVNRVAALVVAEGLVELGVLRGSPDTLVESGAVKLFLPHGIGHLVGLGIRDTGPASDELRKPAPGLPRPRVDIALEPRQAWTVEPGIYVVPALLARERDRKDIDWDRVEGLRHFGGIRLEQNVLITDDGCDVLTAEIPL